MKIDASARAALRKRKQQLRSAVVVHTDEIEEVRSATRQKLQELLAEPAGPPDQQRDSGLSAESIAREIEAQLFENNNDSVNANYRSGFRRLFTCLKDPRADFAARLRSGDLAGREFATKPVEELKSKDQKDTESRIKKENIEKAVSQTMLPETIQQVMDGRDREKWGVSRSAAALDD